MNLKTLSVTVIATAITTFAVFGQSDKIREFELSETTVFKIPTSIGVTTTVLFPDEIGVVGADLVTDPGKEIGKFTFTPGPNHFSISALQEVARTNIQVFCSGKAYSLELTTSNDPLYKAHFVYVGEKTKSINESQRVFDELNGKFLNDIGLKRKFSVNRIIGFLDKCRGLPLLALQDPNPVEDILFEPKEKVYKLNGLNIEIVEAYRDNALDAVGFKIRFTSTNKKQHLYDPESFGISAGEKYYHQIFSAADGPLEPAQYFKEDRSGPGAILWQSDEIIGKAFDEDKLYDHLIDKATTADLPILKHEHGDKSLLPTVPNLVEPQVTPNK